MLQRRRWPVAIAIPSDTGVEMMPMHFRAKPMIVSRQAFNFQLGAKLLNRTKCARWF